MRAAAQYRNSSTPAIWNRNAPRYFGTSATSATAGIERSSSAKHQQQAVSYAQSDQSYAVTTGTGSGKSLCSFIPIIDTAIKARKEGRTPGTRAIVVDPMNALANSQMEELRRYLGTGHPHTPTFARYTGQEGPDERERVKNNPPDILLTNFMMLELLMTRQNELDRKVIANCRGLRFVALDELHTYRDRGKRRRPGRKACRGGTGCLENIQRPERSGRDRYGNAPPRDLRKSSPGRPSNSAAVPNDVTSNADHYRRQHLRILDDDRQAYFGPRPAREAACV